MALRASSEEEDQGAGSEEDEDFEPLAGAKVQCAGSKKSKVVVPKVLEEKGVQEKELAMDVVDDDCQEVESQEDLPHGVHSAETIILDVEGGKEEVEDKEDEIGQARKKTKVLESEDEMCEETEVVREKVEVANKPNRGKEWKKVEELWVVGSRFRNSSGDSEKRTRKKPKKYVESSDSENGGDGFIASDESDDDFEESKKKKPKTKKKSPTKKAPSKAKQTVVTAIPVLPSQQTPSVTPTPTKPLGRLATPSTPIIPSRQTPFSIPSPALSKSTSKPLPTPKQLPHSPKRPLGSHNPSPATPTTPSLTSNSSLASLLGLKKKSIPLPSAVPKIPSWTPPSRVGSSPGPSLSSPLASSLSPGLRRLGLSRNQRSIKPLHTNLHINH